MSDKKETLEELVQKVDKLLPELNRVAEELRQISMALKSIAVSQLQTATVTQPVLPALPHVSEKTQSIEDIKAKFPEDLENLLSFEEKEDFIIVKPRQFLGPENFAKIASLVRGIGGEYISAGKSSHFRVPRRKA